MHTGYGVHTDALHTYASKIDAASDRVTQIMSGLGSLQVPADAFGKVPGAQGLHSSYTEHHDADIQDCRDLADILKDTSDGLAGTADNYRNSEIMTVSGMEDIQR
ncbi:hypothetical protein [Streptomyces sp. NPDC053427]|uniref:hypothetical protein n=1 Tax=Streptomyces sp. NPDC053427 TaxID=3365701 RepID=UPI0037D63454